MQNLKGIIISMKENLLLFFLVVFFFTFVLSQNSIPSDSMETTIGVGDRIIVSMLPYYYRSPQRGEIVVFNGPDGKKWIKRVIGLPGETIDIREGNIYIEGEKLQEWAYLPEEGLSACDPRFEDVGFPYTIPEESYFLMGDNRLASWDSRYIGAVSEEEVTGKAMIRIYPFNKVGSIH